MNSDVVLAALDEALRARVANHEGRSHDVADHLKRIIEHLKDALTGAKEGRAGDAA